MKFHCDRCKTRYSIADERVRGKILKIRCKNCSAVITVKESGSNTSVELIEKPAAAKAAAPRPVATSSPSRPAASAGAPGVALAAKRAHAPAIPAAARAPAKPVAAAARPAAAAAARPAAVAARPAASAAKPASALQGAFATALKRAPDDPPASESLSSAPAVLEAEWYVSLDGEQVGPYTLRKAQDWVGKHEVDDELYCWSEGFDDWLPVEKVSHFRGLRGEGAPTVATRSDPFSESDRTMVDAPPNEAQPSARGLPVPRREDTPVPLFAATMAQISSEAPTEIDEPAPKRNGAGAAPAKAALPKPAAAARLPLPAARSAPLPAPTRPKPHSSQPVPMAAKPAAAPMTPMADEPSAAASLEFEIGEASRVVKLPMLGQHLRTGNAAPRSSPGLPGVGGPGVAAPAAPPAAVDSSPVGRGTGAFGPMPAAHLTQTGAFLPVIQGGGTVEIPRPEILQPKRGSRGMMLPILIGGGVLVTVAAILIYVALSGGDDEEGGERLARARVGGDGLAYQFQDDDKDGKDDKTGMSAEETAEAAKKSITTRRTIKPRSGNSSGGTQPRDPGIGIDETDLNAGTGAFDPDQFFEVYKKNTLGVNLCYNSALKKDPLLSVTNAQVFLTVKTDGTVSSVSIPALTGTELGGCLTKRIKSWRFPKSTDGGSGVLKVIFKS